MHRSEGAGGRQGGVEGRSEWVPYGITRSFGGILASFLPAIPVYTSSNLLILLLYLRMESSTSLATTHLGDERSGCSSFITNRSDKPGFRRLVWCGEQGYTEVKRRLDA